MTSDNLPSFKCLFCFVLFPFQTLYWLYFSDSITNPKYPIQLYNRGTWRTRIFHIFHSPLFCCVFGRPYLDHSHNTPQEFQTAAQTGFKLHKIHYFVAKSWFVFDMKRVVLGGFCVLEASWEFYLCLALENMSRFWLIFQPHFLHFHSSFCADYCFFFVLFVFLFFAFPFVVCPFLCFFFSFLMFFPLVYHIQSYNFCASSFSFIF